MLEAPPIRRNTLYTVANWRLIPNCLVKTQVGLQGKWKFVYFIRNSDDCFIPEQRVSGNCRVWCLVMSVNHLKDQIGNLVLKNVMEKERRMRKNDKKVQLQFSDWFLNYIRKVNR